MKGAKRGNRDCQFTDAAKYYYFPLAEFKAKASFELEWLRVLFLKQRLPVASLEDASSSKDNLIETRTKIIVGAIP